MAKTIAEYGIRKWTQDNFPISAIHLEFTSPRSAVITDQNGDRLRVVYRDGEVRVTDAW